MSRRKIVSLIVVVVGVLAAVSAVLVVARSSGEWRDVCMAERIRTMGIDGGVQRPTNEHMEAVVNKHFDFIEERAPGWTFVFHGDYDDLWGVWAEEGYGITVAVRDLEAYEARPKGDRVPPCLDGVPVRIIELAPMKPLEDWDHPAMQLYKESYEK